MKWPPSRIFKVALGIREARRRGQLGLTSSSRVPAHRSTGAVSSSGVNPHGRIQARYSSTAPDGCLVASRDILAKAPNLVVEGEMRADSALSKAIRDAEFPDSRLTADANLLIMPNVDAANITYNALRVTAGGGITVGGILLGAAKAVHIMTPSSTVRRIVNMTAVAVAGAGAQRVKQWVPD